MFVFEEQKRKDNHHQDKKGRSVEHSEELTLRCENSQET